MTVQLLWRFGSESCCLFSLRKTYFYCFTNCPISSLSFHPKTQQRRLISEKKDHIMLDGSMATSMNEYGVAIKRQRITPPLSERVMLYVRQDNEDVYTALHVVPPTTNGLISAVSEKHFNYFSVSNTFGACRCSFSGFTASSNISDQKLSF